MASNRAAIQPIRNATCFKVLDVPYPDISDDTIIIRNAAVAVNPIDGIIQHRGNMAFPHIKYPFPLGFDTAGEVVAVGKNVRDTRPGDRIVALARGCEASVHSAAESAFQSYVVVRPAYMAHLPPGITYEQAAVIPLSAATAGAALFDRAQLALQLPTSPPRPATGGTVLVWGASTSVGCSAVQLAVAAGYEVVATASPRNWDMVRSLGAAQVFDYRSPDVQRDILAALRGKTVAGAVSIGQGAAENCMDIMGACGPDANKFVTMVSFPVPENNPEHFATLRTVAYFVSSLIGYKVKGMVKGVKYALVVTSKDACEYVLSDFLPKALAAGTFRPMPEPQVVGHGLEHIQTALDRLRSGVSGTKLVVTL